jgi:hypothetical protein
MAESILWVSALFRNIARESMHRRIAYLWLCLTLSGAIGCQSSNDVEAVSESVTPIVTQAAPTATTEPENRTPDPKVASPEPTAVAQFVPPFPGRSELFEPPKRAQGTVRRDDESGDTVELKGFIEVDQPRVVLSIDGVVSPIAEGGEKYGVQVISIQPPSVVLQRGRSRWTATLE